MTVNVTQGEGEQGSRGGARSRGASTLPTFYPLVASTLLSTLAPWLVALGALAGALGWWLPWVLHPNGAAALALLGLDLGEFFKFTSLWREGQMIWERHTFFLPPALASLSLSLLAARTRLRWRLPVAIIAGLLALVLFPEFERRAEFFGNEFWFQVTLGLFGTAVALTVLVAGRRVPARLRIGAGLVIAVAGFVLPVWAFWRVELVLEWLYGTRIVWGPGLWVSATGFALAGIGWIAQFVSEVAVRE